MNEEPDRQMRHVKLDAEIENIYKVLDHTTTLMRKINDEDQCDKLNSVKEAKPSLNGALTDGPGRIREVCDLIHAELDKIHDNLF